MLEHFAISVVVNDIAIGARSPGFDSRAVKSETLSLPLRCFFGAVLSRHQAAEIDPPLVACFVATPRVQGDPKKMPPMNIC